MKRFRWWRPVALVAVSMAALVTINVSAASAVHVACGQTITTDTVLDSDLLNCPGDGIVIGAPGITLDLNGHTIDGDNPNPSSANPEDAGVENRRGHNGVTVKNGRVQEFGAGVRMTHVFQLGDPLDGVADPVVRGISAETNDVGISLEAANHGLVQDNSLAGNRVGIQLTGSDENTVQRNSVGRVLLNGIGIALLGSDRNVVSRNDVATANWGIALREASENQVERNLLRQNAQAISVDPTFQSPNQPPPSPSERNLVAHNTIENVVDGIQLFHGARLNHLRHNDVAGGFRGVFLFGADQNIVRQNTIAEALIAIQEINGGPNEITMNWIRASGAIGIHILGSSGGVIEQNRVLGAGAAGDGFDGIFVDGQSSGWVLARNVANDNGDDGIDVENPSTTLTENRADRNRDLGIEALPGVTDGGGNRASGNGNPAQCTGVACK